MKKKKLQMIMMKNIIEGRKRSDQMMIVEKIEEKNQINL